jgi:L-methionine (R)-S-oxide reductase
LRRYLAPRQLLKACEKILADYHPAPGASPLDELLTLLYGQRDYFWIGIYFIVAGKVVRQAMQGPMPPCHEFALGKGNVGTTAVLGLTKIVPDVTADATYSMCFREVKSEMVTPIRIGRHTLGVIDVESDRPRNFGSADRILLEEVASMLARFLTSKGKLLVRHAREAAQVPNRAKSASAR